MIVESEESEEEQTGEDESVPRGNALEDENKPRGNTQKKTSGMFSLFR